MNTIPRWLWWMIGLLILGYFIAAISGILLPFLVGLAIAYLLDPLADKFQTWRLPRWLATALSLGLFFGALVGVGFAIAPVVQAQVSGFAKAFPEYVAQLRPFIMNLIDQAGGKMRAEQLVESSSSQLVQWAGHQVGVLLANGVAFFNLLSLVLISPVVAFYLLRDWDELIARIDSWLPRDHEATIKSLLSQADLALSGFVRGQSLVCLVMGILYAVGWSLLGLDYALVLGVLAGILAFVPFAGPLFGATLAVVVGIGQYGADYVQLSLIIGVFGLVQLIEGSILTPNLIGDRVGLHPAWVLFAIFAGGELLGFVGVLLAVPMAAVLAVVARWALQHYLDSSLFNASASPGKKKPKPPSSPPAL